jgi:acyl-CoA hydrolase
VSNRRKGQFDGYSVTTFAAGTAELYEWLDGNEAVRFLPVDIVNSPETISRNEEMFTINGALAVDLWGQVAADSLGGRQSSGIGGHEDFVSASGLELGDRSVICLPSTTTSREVSRASRDLPEGMLVTTPPPARPRRHRVRRRTCGRTQSALALRVAHPTMLTSTRRAQLD